MPANIKLKKSSVPAKVPLDSDLAYGELALNFADGRLFYKNSSNEIKSFIDSDNIASAGYLDSSDIGVHVQKNIYIDSALPSPAGYAENDIFLVI